MAGNRTLTIIKPDAASFAGLPMFRDYELPAKLTVRDIMTYHPRTIDPDTALKDAAREMVPKDEPAAL